MAYYDHYAAIPNVDFITRTCTNLVIAAYIAKVIVIGTWIESYCVGRKRYKFHISDMSTHFGVMTIILHFLAK